MTAVVTSFDDLLEDTDLAVSWPENNRTERYRWHQGRMVKHGEERGVDPFFFTGLMAQGLIVHGDFAPPARGEWWGYRNGRRSTYRFYVADVSEGKTHLVYFIRDEFAGWTMADTDRIFDDYARVAPEDHPAITPEMFLSVVLDAHQQKTALEGRQQQIRNMNDARQSMRYARDYLAQAIEYAERRPTT